MKDSLQKQTFLRWLDQHSGIFYKVVRAYARSSHDQEDLFQEISSHVWQAIPRYRKEAKESTFLYRVALFAALAWNRRESRRREDPGEIKDGDLPLYQSMDKDMDPRLEWIYDQISELGAFDRSLTLLMLDGLSYREIAGILGISESNVGVKLTRIKQKWIKLLEKEEQ